MKIKIIDFGALPERLPLRAHSNDAGADVYSTISKTLYPGDVLKIPLGFGLELPDGYAGYIFPRSGLSAKGIVCELPPIDSSYRGEVHAIVSNISGRTYEIKDGDRVGQLVITPVVIADFITDAPTARGQGAFGHTRR